MQGLLENKNWTSQENENFQSIILLLKFTKDQQSILHQQIQKFKSSEKIIHFILNDIPNWEQLQQWIEKEQQNQVQESTQQSDGQQQLWDQEALIKIKNYLSQIIQSNQEVNKILQHIQQTNQSKDIVANVLGCEFGSLEEFIQLIQIFEGQSKILARRSSQQNTNTQNSINTLYDNKQIQQLFTEFQSINGRSNLQVQNLLIQLYSSFQNQKQDPSVRDFQPSPQLEYEDLLLLCIKVKQHFSYYPRPVQLLSVIELFNHNDNKGRLAQIYTGEGKTLIVAMLAILLCKKKKINVDIVTSSPVLAIRDAQELTSFYKLFSVSVAHNINGSENKIQKMFQCYKSQVIYGDPHSFQADILRHEYSELGTMGDRQQGYIIVDEVDSMLIDGNSNKTLLSQPIPGMLDLTKVLRLIWDEICKQLPNLSTDKKIMIIDGDSYYSVDLEEYIEKTLDLQLKEVLYNFIPKFRLNYINFMKKTWIQNAILAQFHFQESKHYLIDNNNVRIIDYENTGVVHKDNMQWQKGLHQFVQLKHNLPITPLRISTNYLSNVGFFKRYQNQLLGLTGTLGSQVTQNLLAKQYQIDFVQMPPFKKRLLKIEPGIATLSRNEWYQEILKSVQQQINSGRAVLIINSTIQDVSKIGAYLKKYKIKCTTYIDDQQELIKEIGPQMVIVATNLAGRGTDLATTQELEKNGGLHVIMSFLPRNIRIQLQGFGRTGRQGKLGTAELIVSFPQNIYVGDLDHIKTLEEAIEYYQTSQKKQMQNYLEVLVFFRDRNEQYYANEIELEMDKLLNEDRCFKKFCQIAKSKVNIKENKAAFQSLEEKWGLYLEQFQDTGLNEDDIEGWLNSDEGQNPKYLIYQGLQKDDLNILQKAAEVSKTDPQAQYYKGLSEIKNGKYESAFISLKQARSLFQSKIDDEKGFATASKLNRIQVEQFQDNEQLPDFQQSEIKIPQQNLELPDLDLSRDSENHNLSAIQFVQQNNVQKDTVEMKINNHLKVYNKVITNIDSIISTLSTFNPKEEVLDLSWLPVIVKEEKDNVDLEQSIKDQQEVIDDGPLPKLGSLTKKKIERSWWDYIAMFAIGLCQFVVGCAICAFTGGAALPLGITLVSEGIQDLLTAVTSAWKGLKIDWGAWGQQKVTKISAALSLAGSAGIKEALHLGGTALQSLKKIGINEFFKQIPKITTEGLKKAGFWLINNDKVKTVIQNQYNALQKVSEVAQDAGNSTQLLSQAYGVLQEEVGKKNIGEETASDLYNLIRQCLSDSSGSVEGFKKNFFDLAKKYIRLQMVKTKQDTQNSPSEIKQQVVEISMREGNKKYQQVKNDIEQYNQYEKAMNNELKYFSPIILDFYSKDQKVQNSIIFLDLYYEKLCNQTVVQESITNKMIQAQLGQNFSVQNQSVQNACNQLQISNSQSMNQFYQGIIRPIIYKLCCDLSSASKYTDPLEVILQLEYVKHFNLKRDQSAIDFQNLAKQQKQIQYYTDQVNSGKKSEIDINSLNKMIEDFNTQGKNYEQLQNQYLEIEKLPYHEIVKGSIGYLKSKGMINDNLTFHPQVLQEFNQYLVNQNFNENLKQILLSAIQSIPNELQKLKSTSKKILSSKLQQAIEVIMLDEIKKYIFETRMQKADEKIMSKID